MTTIRSRKNKGKKLQKEVQNSLLESFPQLEQDDIRNAIMGEPGVDLKLSPAARKLIPFSIECKNVEKVNIWKAIEQSEDNIIPNTTPIVVFRKNRSETYVAIKYTDFLTLIKPQKIEENS